MSFSGFQDFDPRFRSALEQMLGDRPGITINSGYRTPQRQAELFAQALEKYGSVKEARIHVAPAPGTYNSQGSRHNFGLAADLAYASPEDRAWALANAEAYGLNFRMGHEPWHIELIGGKPTPVHNGTNANALVAQNDTLPPAEQQPTPERLENFDFTPPSPIPIVPLQTASSDIFALSNLVSSKEQKAARAQDILKKIRAYS